MGIDRAVQNAVGSEQYGFYYALFNFSFLLNILLDCGITNFNNKNIAQNSHLLNKHLSSIVVLRIFLAAAYLIVSLGIGFSIGYDSKQLLILSVLCFNQVIISFILYLRSNIAGLHLFKTDSFISVLDRLIMISICAILLWGGVTNGVFKIEWYIYGQTVSYLITALITMVIVIDKAKLKKLNLSMVFFIMILKKSYPYAILVLLMTFYNRIDTVMLERILPDGNQQSGIYASAYRLLDSANMIAFLFAGLLLPLFARMLKLQQNVEELVRLAFTLLVIPALIVASVSFFYRTEIMELLYHEHIEESASLFGILMSCFVPIATTYIFGTLLTANGNLKELNLVACTGMIINITLNFIFIPAFKAQGAAISSLTTQLLTAIAQILLVQSLFKFRKNFSFLFKVFIFLVSIIGISFFSKEITSNWMLNICIAALGSFLVAFGLKIISIKAMHNIVKYGD